MNIYIYTYYIHVYIYIFGYINICMIYVIKVTFIIGPLCVIILY